MKLAFQKITQVRYVVGARRTVVDGARLEVAPSPGGQGDSKVQLMLAAERLFADQGIDGTSLREIATAAGHGNNNAVRYHFGSKEGLIQAIFQHRIVQLEPARARLITAVEEKGLTGDVRSLWEVIVLPHLTLRDSDGRFPYASFLLQYLLNYRPRGMVHAADGGTLAPNLQRTMDYLFNRLSFLPLDVADQRIMSMTATFLAVLIHTENRANRPDPAAFRAIVDDTLNVIAAGLSAPAPRVSYFIDDSVLT
ncbi:TetR/AcrR family transcriptional regulator [Novosphingobium sp. KCTC 2891]|uniref:TetR/AcrR family transcriptional regulator n=1 Tax=Novosphingobium sp. KCTC 2891 TaxID=2989730 RepID=UPI002221D402|nr:TetR/AcrR family transcriptional regulator [Novosphingobium sp. KCTC 2891]MCW1384915.1 TetR/AcrR family transcriptional regulator [Novosphingobium sp. KCTC 2891]